MMCKLITVGVAIGVVLSLYGFIVSSLLINLLP